MQQSSPQRPQHAPQQQQQQISRASPQLMQHLQQHQQQIHLQQLQQQQQQQQQLQHHLQQQQHLQSQQIQPQQIQQIVMHTAYVNQPGTPTRPAPPRLLNQALNNPSGVTLVRAPVRTVRPRRQAMRSQMPTPPLQVPAARLLNSQHQQANASAGRGINANGASVSGGVGAGRGARVPRPGSPRVLNPHAGHAQHRPPRSRTPLMQQTQQQQQQHQLTQHVINHSQVQQLNQLKLATQQQQILLNQQNQQHVQQPARVITPQGTIVTQTLQTPNTQHLTVQTNQNGPLPQTLNATQRASPHPQVKKVVVQPNNANDMDLEESITAAIVQKNPVNENVTTPQQFHTQPSMRQNHNPGAHSVQHINFSPQHGFQQQIAYEHHMPQTPQSLNQLLLESENPDEGCQYVTLSNGQSMSVAEYKRMQHTSRTLIPHQQQARESGRQTLVRSKEQPRPVQRVHPMQTQQANHMNECNDSASGPSEQSSELPSAKMLIFLQSGEQRLITFTLPKESCTLQEVLEQVNVPFTEDTQIQCMQNTSTEIDYFVTVGSTMRIEEMLENHPMLVGGDVSNSSTNISSQAQSSEMSTPEKGPCPENANNSPESPEQRSPPPRYVDGMLAVCKSCGYTGFDFSRCQRCKRVFTEEPKSVPIPNKNVDLKKKEPEKSLLDKHLPCGESIKLNLLKSNVKTINNKTIIQEKKPTRVRKQRGKQPDPEPVILTLSSDEEDSNSSMLNNQHEQSINMKEPSLSEIEGGTSDSGIGIDNMDDESREEIFHNLQGIEAFLNCRTIRIGSYRYSPKEKVHISSKGIKIVAPSLKNENRDVALQIPLKDVVRMLVHFGKGLPVIFLYTMNKCGVLIRKALEMMEESGQFYNPSSKEDPYKRITLLPDVLTDETKTVFKSIFGKRMEELTAKEANEILVRTCPIENSNTSKLITRSMSTSINSGNKSTHPAEIRQILIYPPGKGGIPINTEDYMCLAQDQFLNDVIIDFYLKHLVHDILTASQREKTHIFSTFFYKRLTTKPSKVNKSSNPHEWDSTLTPAQKRHARVKTWTKNVNIFEKDFIVVPINENCHWFVAIICYPSLDGCRSMIDNRAVIPHVTKRRERKSSMQIGSTTITPLTKQEQLTLNCDSDNLSERDEAEAEESDLDMQCDSDDEESEKVVEKKPETPVVRKNEPIKQPCILIFDSLAGASRSRVVATLRDYLTCEYQAKISPHKVFNKDNIKGSCPKIPQQNNFTDCGLYLLQYVEHFFKDPIVDYSLPIKQLANWFDEIVVTRKREEISILLKNLMHKYNPDSHLALPDITFPTLHGKLIENEEQAEERMDCEKGPSNKVHKNDKESEGPTVTFLKQTPSGEILVKRNFGEETILRKTIRLSNDSENRSVVQIKQEYGKKGDNENQIVIPIKLHSSDLVQNSLIVNKGKNFSDKKHGVNNQTVSSVNCVRQNVSESDSNSFLKGRRINKLEDVVNDSNKKFKRNEC
nr:uncharacterized protein LOC116765553 isoform X5 [Danaus plexippus plexippus]